MQKLFKQGLSLVVGLSLLLGVASCVGGGDFSENVNFTWQSAPQNAVQFHATPLVNGEAITSFHWDFGDGDTETTTLDVINHQYGAAGDYTVTLTGSDGFGNTYTVTHTASASP